MKFTTIKLPLSAKSYDQNNFRSVLQQELEQLPHEQLPLQQSLRQSSLVSADPFQVMVMSVAKHEDDVVIKVGIFFQGIIAGCSCADDPTPIDTVNEFCELRLLMDKTTGETQVKLLEAN